jgi:hypothetical protein
MTTATETRLAALEEKLLRLELQLEQMNGHQQTYHRVLSWLLAKQPEDKGLLFLSLTANSIEELHPHLEEDLAALDALIEDVIVWREHWAQAGSVQS